MSHANEMSQDGGRPCQKIHVIKGLGHLISAQPPGRRVGLEIEFNRVANGSINPTYVIRP